MSTNVQDNLASITPANAQQPVVTPAQVPAAPVAAPAQLPAQPAPVIPPAQPVTATPGTLTQAQVKLIIQNAPPGVQPADIINGLVSKGYQLQGYDPNATPVPVPSFLSQVGSFLGGLAQNIAKPVASSVLAPFQAVKSYLDYQSDPTGNPDLGVNVPGLGKVEPANSIEQASGNALGTAALGLSPEALAESGVGAAGIDAAGAAVPGTAAKVLGGFTGVGALFGGANAMSNNSSLPDVLKAAGFGALTGKATELAFGVAGSALSKIGSTILQPFSSAASDINNDALLRLGYTPINPDEVAAGASPRFSPQDVALAIQNPDAAALVTKGEGGLGASKFTAGIDSTVNAMRTKLFNTAAELSQNLKLDELGNVGDVSASEGGQAVKDALDSVVQSTKDARNQMVQQSLKTPEFGEIPIKSYDIAHTKEVLDDIISQKQASLLKTDPSDFEELRNNLSTSTKRNVANLWQTHLDVEAKAFPKFGSQSYASPEVAQWRMVNAALNQDIDSAVSSANPQVAKAFSAMKQYTQDIHAVVDQPLVKLIDKTDPAQVISKIIKPNNIDQINFLKSTLSGTPEVFDKVKMGFLDSLMEKSTDSMGQLDAAKFVNSLERYGDATLETLFGKDGVQTIAKFKSQALLNDLVDKSMQGGELSIKKLSSAISRAEGADPGILERSLPEGTYQTLKDVQQVGSSVESYEKFRAGKTPGGLTAGDIATAVAKIKLLPLKLLGDLVEGPAVRGFLGTDIGQKLATGGFGEIQPLMDAGAAVKGAPRAYQKALGKPLFGR